MHQVGVALPQKFFSFTPGFSPVENPAVIEKPFQRFPGEITKTVETVFCDSVRSNTGLKPGVNENDF